MIFVNYQLCMHRNVRPLCYIVFHLQVFGYSESSVCPIAEHTFVAVHCMLSQVEVQTSNRRKAFGTMHTLVIIGIDENNFIVSGQIDSYDVVTSAQVSSKVVRKNVHCVANFANVVFTPRY